MPTENLPAVLAGALGESWQRIEQSSATRFVRAPATPGAQNAIGEEDAATDGRGIRIDEIAPAGPAGHGDDFVEFANTARNAVDVSGWRVYRCTAGGVADADTLQHTFPDGVVLEPGERYVLGGPAFASGSADARTATSLADTVSGVLLVRADGVRADGVTVSNHPDTACQDGPDKLASTLDYRTGESWQRDPRTGVFGIAERTPGTENRPADIARPAVSYDAPTVAVSEVATDPAIAGAPEGFVRRNYVELANYGDAPVDIAGWRVLACGEDGFRRFDDLASIAPGTTLAPGETWLAALEGTAEASTAQAVYAVALSFQGSGVWVEAADGSRVDSVGTYHANEMDHSVDRHSPCTKGRALATFAVDRLVGETYQRTGFSGVDADDFVAARATPGVRDERVRLEPALRAADTVARLSRTIGAVVATSAAPFETPVGPTAVILDAYAGTSTAPLLERSGEAEHRIAELDTARVEMRNDGYAFPYVRMTIAAAAAKPALTWDGAGIGRGVLRLSVWDPSAGTWRALDEQETVPGPEGAEVWDAESGPVRLTGRVRAHEVTAGAFDVLVQAVPRAVSRVADDVGGFADPAAYDLAISHLTDTQYLTESYSDVYADMVGWILANAEARKIAFATHTGDLVQSWVDPDQPEDRARAEYEIASQLQGVLDAGGVANSVLPGNHDNKRGVTNDLFNEYFPPARYEHEPWYGGSIAASDNSAGFALVERAGAKLLMLWLPYAYGEREIAWAERIVAEHPDRNVILSTHEHVTPAAPGEAARRSGSSRWLSRADQLWDRVIAPNPQVVAVLSGHFHGLGRIVTEDAGGIPGHTVVELLADYQEFRTHTGTRATGFQRLLQIDLAAGAIAVDTYSATLDAHASFAYDYEQFVPDNGHESTASNDRPWRVVAHGLQARYTETDDDFTVGIRFQYAKAVLTAGIWAG